MTEIISGGQFNETDEYTRQQLEVVLTLVVETLTGCWSLFLSFFVCAFAYRTASRGKMLELLEYEVFLWLFGLIYFLFISHGFLLVRRSKKRNLGDDRGD